MTDLHGGRERARQQTQQSKPSIPREAAESYSRRPLNNRMRRAEVGASGAQPRKRQDAARQPQIAATVSNCPSNRCDRRDTRRGDAGTSSTLLWARIGWWLWRRQPEHAQARGRRAPTYHIDAREAVLSPRARSRARPPRCLTAAAEVLSQQQAAAMTVGGTVRRGPARARGGHAPLLKQLQRTWCSGLRWRPTVGESAAGPLHWATLDGLARSSDQPSRA